MNTKAIAARAAKRRERVRQWVAERLSISEMARREWPGRYVHGAASATISQDLKAMGLSGVVRRVRGAEYNRTRKAGGEATKAKKTAERLARLAKKVAAVQKPREAAWEAADESGLEKCLLCRGSGHGPRKGQAPWHCEHCKGDGWRRVRVAVRRIPAEAFARVGCALSSPEADHSGV
jgi:rubrerythrin